MDLIEIIALVISGVIVGFINTIAGGGTILTISLLIFLGYPAAVANGTNRIAVVFQNLVAVINYYRQGVLDIRKGLILSLPTVAGSLLGAITASEFSEGLIEKSVAFVLISMLFIILYKPDRWLNAHEELITKKITWTQIIIFLLIGFYGGFIHIGIGFYLLAALVLSCGYNLSKANPLKNLIVLVYSPITLIVFAIADLVDYKSGLILSAGNIIGAYFASRYTIKLGSGFIRIVLIVLILITIMQLFGFVNLHTIFGVIL